jgi:hypothetical protein
MRFHTALEHARQHAGLTYEGWAERAQSGASYLYRICHRQSKPERDMVIRLCVGLGLPAKSINTFLELAGHFPLDDSLRDRFLAEAIAERLTVLQIHRLLVAADFPGLLESSRRLKRQAGWGARVARPPISPTHP